MSLSFEFELSLREFSHVAHAVAWYDTYLAADHLGQALVLEQSTRGAVDWVRARPPDDAEHAPRFARFSEQRALVVTHQTFLLERPSVPSGCQGCGAQDAWQQRNHLATCPCGIRASDTLHHPIRSLLVAMLREAYGSGSVLEEPAVYWIYSEIKRPDIVVPNANGPGRHHIIGVCGSGPVWWHWAASRAAHPALRSSPC